MGLELPVQLLVRSPNDGEVFLLLVANSRHEAFQIRWCDAALAVPLKRWLSGGLVEWDAALDVTRCTITAPRDPEFLERLGAHLRENGFAVEVTSLRRPSSRKK